MDKAINILKAKSKQAFVYFIIQLILFHLSSFMLMWLLYPGVVAVITNVVLGVFLYFFIQNGQSLMQELWISDDDGEDTLTMPQGTAFILSDRSNLQSR